MIEKGRKMKNILISTFAMGMMLSAAETNTSTVDKSTKEQNLSSEKSRIEEQIKKQMEKEKKFAKEQTFYQGDEYDLKGAEVDPNSLSTIPAMEPEYDFDMSEGVYSD